MSLPNVEDVTSQSLVDNISNNKWVKARATLIRDYAVRETALKAADEIEALLDNDTSPAVPAFAVTLRAWISATREASRIHEETS